MQISETTISKICEASLCLAAAPLDATSTLWPSLRKLISSSSQMDRSSSTISIWAIALDLPYRTQEFRFNGRNFAGRRAGTDRARELYHKFRTASFLGLHTNSSVVRLENLVNDGQTEPSATGKPRLERLKEPVRLAGIETDACVADRDAYGRGISIEAHGQRSSRGHCTKSVVAK